MIKFFGENRLTQLLTLLKSKFDALSARIKQPDWNQTDTTADDYIKNKPTSVVTGVKGNAESIYRSGDVNLTAANVGALPDATVPVNKGGTGATTKVGAIENLFGTESKYRMKYVSSGESVGNITAPEGGLAIWQADDESAGIILTGDGVYIFAPPDNDALIFINEDENSTGWSIDGEGTLKDSNGDEIYMRGGAYLPLSGGTMTGKITRDAGGAWISARDNALIMITRTSAEGSDWHPVVAVKTSNGCWSFGSVGGETLCLSYDTDTNYINDNNTSSVINFPAAGKTGTLALLEDTVAKAYTIVDRYNNSSPIGARYGGPGVSPTGWGCMFGTEDGETRILPVAAAGGPTGSTLVCRTSEGYINATYFNASCGDESSYFNSNSHYIIYATNDGYFRKATLSRLKELLGISLSNAKHQINTGFGPLHAGSWPSFVSNFINNIAPTDMSSKLSLNIEQWADETSGISFNGDCIIMWSPCDGASLVYFDEDDGTIVWYIGESGYFSGTAARANQVSDRNKKHDIAYITDKKSVVDFINKLEPATFKYNDDCKTRMEQMLETEPTHHGLIAQDVEEILKDTPFEHHGAFVKCPKTKKVREKDEKGKTINVERVATGEYDYYLDYSEFVPDLITYCQYLNNKVERLENELAEIKELLKGVSK